MQVHLGSVNEFSGVGHGLGPNHPDLNQILNCVFTSEEFLLNDVIEGAELGRAQSV